VNYSVASLREFFREVGGPKWVLSRVPLSMIKCDQTHMTVKDLLDTADSVSDRRRLSKQARQMARDGSASAECVGDESRMNSEREVERIVNRIAKEYQPLRVILFGSYAWGEPTDDSDIDLLSVQETRERVIDRRVAVEPVVVTPEVLRRRVAVGDQLIREIGERRRLRRLLCAAC
jgi:predicted nucleotidyltransferase